MKRDTSTERPEAYRIDGHQIRLVAAPVHAAWSLLWACTPSCFSARFDFVSSMEVWEEVVAGITTDVTDEAWWFVLPHFVAVPQCGEDAGQWERDPREVFDAVRYVARNGRAWRLMPGDLPPWAALYRQFWRWRSAGVFESRP